VPEAVILGVNEVGYESANDRITDGRDLAWLQDVPEVDAWTTWDIAYRDIVVLDEQGAVRGVVNVTTHDLSVEANAAALSDLLRP